MKGSFIDKTAKTKRVYFFTMEELTQLVKKAKPRHSLKVEIYR